MIPKAGPELDRLVAEKIMGLVPCQDWTRFNLGSAGGPALMKSCNHANGECYPSNELGTGFGGKVGGCPRYSTDWNTMKEVVEKLKTKWSVQMTETSDLKFEVILFAGDENASESAGEYSPITKSGYSEIESYQEAESIPHAVCLVALRAIKVIPEQA